jgi:hypothetical protein
LQIPERVRALLAVPFKLITARQGKWADVARLLADQPGLSCAAVARLCGMSKAAAARAMRAARAAGTAAPGTS